jgi:hypothetical protein
MKSRNLASDQLLDISRFYLFVGRSFNRFEQDFLWHSSWTFVTSSMVRTIFLFFTFFLGFSSFSWAQLNSRVLLQNESFVSPEFEAVDHNQYQYVGFNLRNSLDSEKLILDSEAVMAVGNPILNYLKFKEAAIMIPNSNSQSLIVGRKKIQWSELDESWSFGAIEPVFKWNPLDREAQGLTGLFWITQQPWLQFTAFVSPVFLPDQGPSFSINRDGQFAKNNPWFQMPPKSFQLPGSTSTSEIRYRVQKPSESEVISQTSLGGSLEGTIDDSFLWRTSYFYKPMNQIAMGYKGIYNTGTDLGLVDILPQVGFHRVISADLVFSTENYRTGISYVSDQPEQVKFESEWTAPIFQSASLYSTFFQYNYKKQVFKFEYLTVEGGRVKEVGDWADAERAPLSSRYPFYEAARAHYEFEILFPRKQKTNIGFSWTHSEKNQFDLIQFQSQYSLSRRLQIFSELQLVKSQPLNARNFNEISPQENNDRFMLGLSYEL